jgi:hypothetical protein
LHGPFTQILCRKSGSAAFGGCSGAGSSRPTRGAGTILPSSPGSLRSGTTRPGSGSGGCAAGFEIIDPALGLGETETWLGAGVGPADEWLPMEELAGLGLGLGPGLGLGLGLGLLGALLCDTLALDEALDETLGAGLGAGAGGGLLGAALGGGLGGALGALLGGVCWAKTVVENNRTAATTRLESRIKHLLPLDGPWLDRG